MKYQDKIVIISYKTPEPILKVLEGYGVELILTCPHSKLPKYINDHPDMVIAQLGHSELVIEPSVFEYYYQRLKGKGIILHKGLKKIEGKYPLDIAYNCLKVGNIMFHNLRYTDQRVLDVAKNIGLELVHVKQGYSRCSSLVVNDKLVITSDKGMEKALKNNGIEVLCITEGSIKLESKPYGFIGGASGELSKDEIAFLGNFNTHNELKDLKIKDKKLISLSKGDLIDLGSIITLTRLV